MPKSALNRLERLYNDNGYGAIKPFIGRPVDGWPDDGGMAYFGDLSGEVIQLIKQAYKVKRKKGGYKDLKIKKFDSRETATSPKGSELLKADQLRYSDEEQGRDPLTEIIGHAIRLGFEQGARYQFSDMMGDGERLMSILEMKKFDDQMNLMVAKEILKKIKEKKAKKAPIV